MQFIPPNILSFNPSPPTLMHIDLNSCFATAEQQANPHLRGKPIVVAAYETDNGCVLSPSIEAKRYGIKTGMRVKEAKELYPGVVVRSPDPPKYRDIHIRFIQILENYSPYVSPRSIDEAVIDFSWLNRHCEERSDEAIFINKDRHALRARDDILLQIAQNIKRRIREKIGEWISCSIGISTNHFLAKLAAGLHKPDGLDVIDGQNIEAIYQTLKLTDLPGINVRTQIRLNSHGIWTPLDLLHASAQSLQYGVFQSVVGSYWHQRLRGWRVETDAIEWERKSFGHQYALGKWTDDEAQLLSLLMKLTEKTGRRLRRNKYAARGVSVFCIYIDRTSWHKSQTFEREMYTTQDLYQNVQYVFKYSQKKKVALLSVSCFHLVPLVPEQQELFEVERQKWRSITDALDCINDRFGEFTVTSARMMNMRDKILDRISFGKGGIPVSS